MKTPISCDVVTTALDPTILEPYEQSMTCCRNGTMRDERIQPRPAHGIP